LTNFRTTIFHEPGGGDERERVVSTKREERIEVSGNKTIKTTKVITNVTEYYYATEEDYSEEADFDTESHSLRANHQ